MNVYTDKHSSVIAANQGEAHHPAEFADRPLHWSSVIAGLFNSTPGINAITPPVPGGSMVSLLIPTGSSTAHNTTSMTSSTSTLEKPHAVSIVTITDRTTVTETSCSASSTPINSLKTPSTLPTSSIDEDVVGGTLPVTPGVSKTTLVPPVNTPAIPALSSDYQASQPTVVMITKTAWSTTWTSVTAQPTISISSPAKESHFSASKDLVNGRPQQPIDQAYAKPVPSPVTTPMMPQTPVLINSTTSCTSNGTTSLGLASKTSTGVELSISRPTVHTALPIFGTAGTQPIKTSQFLHPTPRTPVVPSLPLGHPLLFSNGTVVRNHTTVSFYHEKPTIHPGAVSISKGHITTAEASSTSHPVAKCTTTFLHSPTQDCTSTSYVHTKTIAVDCYGCVGEQAQAIRKADLEAKVRTLSIPKQFIHKITNQSQQVCNASISTTITLPVSKKSVCAGPVVATGGSMHPKGKPSSTHGGSSGFVTSTSAGVHGSGYGHGNWTGSG
jgi:hypothetical protein